MTVADGVACDAGNSSGERSPVDDTPELTPAGLVSAAVETGLPLAATNSVDAGALDAKNDVAGSHTDCE